MILALILACEIGFWVLAILGLAARYHWQKPRLGMALLRGVLLLDLILLGAVGYEIASGQTAGPMHVLAVIYLAISLAYGHLIIAWLDGRFRRKPGDPAPPKPAGMAYALRCWRDLIWDLLAIAIAWGAARLLSQLAADPAQTAPLHQAVDLFVLILVIDAIWAASYTIWPRKAAP